MSRFKRVALSFAVSLSVLAGPAMAGEADVIDVRVVKTGNSYRFDVTVQHHDKGWDHYANAWEVLAPDGTVLGLRTLYHPHVEEQPFTRSLSGVKVPDGITEVRIRAKDSVHDWGGKEITVKLP